MGEGQIEIDKDAYSGRSEDVGAINVPGLDNYSHNPDILINRGGNSIPVYSRKVNHPPLGVPSYYAYSCEGEVLHYIQPDEFYTRYYTGSSSYGRWITNGDYVHRVIYRGNDGNVNFGYIQEDLSMDDYNIKDSSLAFQEAYHFYHYDEDTNSLVEFSGSPAIYEVKRQLNYYTGGDTSTYLGTLHLNDKLLIDPPQSEGGAEYGWRMWFNKKSTDGGITWNFLDIDNNDGAFVDLGYEYGTIGTNRAIW